ncbi:hypothetical protein VTH8203_03390 [Vibrio thalassae]|uniref:Uncharacterized protein n=1 Tax=Vibrio thalassae TaxID=1243014 RepID=A0A240EM25_9VIBR|nr:hypothetical protein [Vibrio thalassae]SNX49742.1 hypothetical protein VTH8203_03390 [Vibrio thalassae]
MIPSFTLAAELYDTQHNFEWLRAFALGVQHPAIHTIVSTHPNALTSLDGQAQVEAAARAHWRQAQCHCGLRWTLNRYATALCGAHNLTFEDIDLHLAYPELPLLKYYGALLKASRNTDKEPLWRRHLAYCRALSLALYEYSRAPDSQLCYSASSIVTTSAAKKESVCFRYQATAHCYHVNDWRYFLLPMPWEPT